jgi:hypothetical protein
MDYSISGVNDSCTLNSKLDLHVIDTFVATVKTCFQVMHGLGRETTLLVKTCDLKSASRQVPVMASHLKFAYFCIYNPFFCPSPLPFGGDYGLESYSRTSGESNHHRQSVSAIRVTPYQLSHEGDYFCIYNPDFQESRGSQVPHPAFWCDPQRVFVFEAGSDAPLHCY